MLLAAAFDVEALAAVGIGPSCETNVTNMLMASLAFALYTLFAIAASALIYYRRKRVRLSRIFAFIRRPHETASVFL